MTNRLVISALGEDRPGIVREIARELYRLGCNIEDSTMTQLRGDFAVMMVISAPPEITPEQVEKNFDRIHREMGLSVEVRPFVESKKKNALSAHHNRCILSLSGGDRPGIVYEVSKLLAEREINISDIKTRVLSDSSGDTYIMVLEIELPREVKFSALKVEISGLAEELKVDITLDPMVSEEI